MHGAAHDLSVRTVPASGMSAGEDDHDRLILAVAASRDRAAFARLFEHFAPRLKAYLIRAGAPPAMAEDFAQDAMLTVWRKADLFDPRRARAATWIFTIARNRRIDVLRRDRRPPPVPDLSLAAADPARPDDLFEGREDAGRIREAMAVLTRDQTQVIQMAFFQDCAHSEIATMLGLPLGTVKSRIRNAMIKLRAILGPPIDEDPS